VRDETPAHEDKFALMGLFGVADDGLEGCRRDVIVPWWNDQALAVANVERFGDLLFVRASIVTAAHSSIPIPPAAS
jgi:hypothetical protein